MGRKAFTGTTISVDVHRMIKHLENDALRLGEATTPAEIAEAYTVLCFSRKFLYEYLEDSLEVPEGTATTFLRFL